MAFDNTTHLGPMTAPNDDRPVDVGSRYVIDAAARADLQSTIKRDLEAVGRRASLEDIAAAVNVIRAFPAAWQRWSPDAASPNDRAAYSTLLAWQAAKEEVSDPAALLSRLRLQADEQARHAARSEELTAEFQGRLDNATARGWTEDAAVWRADMERHRASAASYRERARVLEAQIAALNVREAA